MACHPYSPKFPMNNLIFLTARVHRAGPLKPTLDFHASARAAKVDMVHQSPYGVFTKIKHKIGIGTVVYALLRSLLERLKLSILDFCLWSSNSARICQLL